MCVIKCYCTRGTDFQSVEQVYRTGSPCILHAANLGSSKYRRTSTGSTVPGTLVTQD